ncbi:beta-lactamase regulator AmpE [Aliiglaciecola sp. 3_MG-2023]|uniref:beta-lactamase regulator AmpE n=1 Tax=Aliiglaciecola sp. 3_MG-2023 TaxID=3062644 RepID=UPI0026E33F9E|nr:beta-lactamase regulator AmpE [Aliiglaciecola sp. 3_MG-2023]MDO6695012.1 beta-lactamase regulator AmpE [Aliiglaciecola sp. 3_MG-2023]
MTLISLIVVLMAERIATQTKYWRESFYNGIYQNFLTRKGIFSEDMTSITFLAVVLIPAFFILVLLNSVDNSLIRLILDTAILMVCIGCPKLREIYKCYLQAANRGDFQACSLYADQLGHSGDSPRSFGQALVWLNYQHYAAVIIWFAILGPAGAVMYVIARSSTEAYKNEYQQDLTIAEQLMAVLDWLPVRITTLGLLLMGHFSKALPIWLTYLFDLSISAKEMLCSVADAAEEVECDKSDYTEEPCTLVRLAKRNVMFLVVLISVLSLSGWLR